MTEKKELGYDVRQLQLRLASMLGELKEVLDREGLTYYIWAGSLIGAVRHKGFIPWDDDLDIAMPRKDYDRLCRECKTLLPKHLEFIAMETDDKHQFPFGKVQDARTTLIERKHMGYVGGVYIDIFPLDTALGPGIGRTLHLARYRLLKRLLYLVVRDPYRHGHGPSSWAPLLVQRLFTLKGLHRTIKRAATRFNAKATGWLADYDTGARATFPTEWTASTVQLDFEGMPVSCPAGYDKLLTQIYGDYMQLPPEDKRKQHVFYHCDLDHPYRDFKG